MGYVIDHICFFVSVYIRQPTVHLTYNPSYDNLSTFLGIFSSSKFPLRPQFRPFVIWILFHHPPRQPWFDFTDEHFCCRSLTQCTREKRGDQEVIFLDNSRHDNVIYLYFIYIKNSSLSLQVPIILVGYFGPKQTVGVKMMGNYKKSVV